MCYAAKDKKENKSPPLTFSVTNAILRRRNAFSTKHPSQPVPALQADSGAGNGPPAAAELGQRSRRGRRCRRGAGGAVRRGGPSAGVSPGVQRRSELSLQQRLWPAVRSAAPFFCYHNCFRKPGSLQKEKKKKPKSICEDLLAVVSIWKYVSLFSVYPQRAGFNLQNSHGERKPGEEKHCYKEFNFKRSTLHIFPTSPNKQQSSRSQ